LGGIETAGAAEVKEVKVMTEVEVMRDTKVMRNDVSEESRVAGAIDTRT
jgi:hypothetical protein